MKGSAGARAEGLSFELWDFKLFGFLVIYCAWQTFAAKEQAAVVESSLLFSFSPSNQINFTPLFSNIELQPTHSFKNVTSPFLHDAIIIDLRVCTSYFLRS
jgi:hypothetical protein